MIINSFNLILRTRRQFIVSLSIVLLSAISIQGQQSRKDSKTELGIGITDFSSFLSFAGMYGNYQLSAFYKISNSFSIGIQGAYAGFRTHDYATDEYTKIYEHVVSYNLAGKVYLTSLLTAIEDRKLHIYAKAKLGAMTYIPVIEEVIVEGTRIDYGAYMGIEYTPFQRFGIFLELGYGKKNFSQFGILFRF